MNKILIWSVTAALAGFLFGFDTVVISGADKQLQLLWHSSDAFHGSVVMAMALWGTVVGAIFGGIPTNKIGRKKTLFWIGILYFISAVGAAFANDPFVFAAFRFIGGLGVGASTIAAPAYVSEIAPADKRGRLVALYQFNIVLGILIAFISNYFLKDIGENAWRWMVGVQAIPSVIYILFILTIPESPRWLLSKNRDEEARKVLYKIDPTADLKDIMDDSRENGVTKHENIFMKKYRFPLILAFLIAFFNQFSGINAFLYYAPRIFEEAGLGQNTALLSSIGIGITNLIFTLIGVALIDKLGRKLLMYIGSVGYIISLGLVSAAFYFNWGGLSVPIFLFLFIASHAIGQGAVIWVFISEIFPNHIRASGQAFGSSVHWVLAAIIPSLIPMLFSEIGPEVVFLIFTLMMVLQLLFVIFMMPETKGISLEVLSENLTKKKSKTMKSKKHLPLAFYSALVISIGGCKPYSAVAQTTTVSVSTSTEEQMYRPNFHFTPKKGWMNDPNGMFYANGYYHLFYQYYPDGNKWGPMHWGHAISKDLVKWEEQPIAIYPDNDKYIFSGSAVVDTDNTSGLGNGKTAPIVAIYTLHDMTKEKEGKIDVEQQDIAYSNDNGFTWQKFKEGNPVVKNPGIRDFRDPKATWDETHKQWIMVLAAQDRSQFYKSKDLKNWEYLSDFGKNIGAHGGVWECPDFFEIKVQGTSETKWVLIQSLNPGGANGGSGTQYFIGDFDGTTFTLDSNFAKRVEKEKAVWIDYGKDNYAGVTWNNIPSADGRRLFIGWMSNWEYAQQVPTNAWRSATTIAREIQLIKKGENYSLVSNPVKEINKYVSKTIKGKNLNGKGKLSIVAPGKIDLTQAIVNFSLKNIKQDTYTITLSNEAGEALTFGLNNSDHYLFLDRSKAGKNDFSDKFASTITKAALEGSQKEGAFKIILDKTSIELFYNNGEKVITEIFFTNQPFTALSVSSKEGVELSNLVINQLNIN